jgi:hypothetical protein
MCPIALSFTVPRVRFFLPRTVSPNLARASESLAGGMTTVSV